MDPNTCLPGTHTLFMQIICYNTLCKVKNGWESRRRTRTEQLDQILPSLCQHTRFHGLFGVIFRPILTILRTYCRTVEPVCFTQVKYDWETKEGARTEQLNPIKPLIGQHTRSHGSQQVIFRPIQLFLRTYCDLADSDRLAEVKYGWESFEGTRTE